MLDLDRFGTLSPWTLSQFFPSQIIQAPQAKYFTEHTNNPVSWMFLTSLLDKDSKSQRGSGHTTTEWLRQSDQSVWQPLGKPAELGNTCPRGHTCQSAFGQYLGLFLGNVKTMTKGVNIYWAPTSFQILFMCKVI